MSLLRKVKDMIFGQKHKEKVEAVSVLEGDLKTALRKNELAAARLQTAAMTDVFKQITDRMQ